MDNIQTISMNHVRRGEFGYLYTRAASQIPVVKFVEQQLLGTYPTLEIGLILGFTAGLFVGVPMLIRMCARLCDIVRIISNGAKKLGTKVGAGLCDLARAISDGAKKCRTKTQDALWKRIDSRSKRRDSAQGEEFFEIHPLEPHLNSGDGAPPPPAYSYRESFRVFVEAEDYLDDLRY